MLISIVIPAFNEADCIQLTNQALTRFFASFDFEVLWVDDGSRDDTLQVLKAQSALDKRFRFISLSRNFGHQKALKAGLDHASGDCVISMDADLQHPPELIPQMIARWKEGYDVVYTIRQDRLASVKALGSKAFYSVFRFMAGKQARIPYGAADFRLMDRKVVEALKDFNETALFLRGMIAWMGFRQTSIEYEPNQRVGGTAKYNLVRMVSLALDGLTSFSINPLRLSMVAGFLVSLFAVIYVIYALAQHFILNQTVTGWTSLVICVLFTSGIQLIILGIIGEYLGKTYIECKRRPQYLIKESNLG